MVTQHEAAKYVLDCDGGTRDVTFTPTTGQAVQLFIRSLLTEYRVDSAFDNEGIDRIVQLQTGNPFDECDGYIHAVLTNGVSLIRCLQLFVDWEPDSDEYCVEVSFFPNDVNRDLFSMATFRAAIECWNELLRADDYFVRYENASWELYDPNGLGVIYTRKLPPVAEQSDARETSAQPALNSQSIPQSL